MESITRAVTRLAALALVLSFASEATAEPPGGGTARVAGEVDVGGERREEPRERREEPRERRRVLYVAGMRLPEDAVVEKRKRWGLVGTGATMFAVPYLATLGFWLSDPYYASGSTPATVHIPVVGPFVVAAQGVGSDDHAPGRAVGIPVSGVFQLAGAAMLIVGLSFPRTRVFVSDSPRRALSLQVLPVASRESQGLSLLARF